MKKFKYNTIIIALSPIIALMTVLTVNYLVDPFQIFHRSYLSETQFFMGLPRWQNAGIIRSYVLQNPSEEKAVIMGSSHSANFRTSQITELFKVKKAYNLQIWGAYPKEQKYLMDLIFKSNKIKIIFFEIYKSYSEGGGTMMHPSAVFPKFLYTDSIFDRKEYLLNRKNFVLSVRRLWGIPWGQPDLETTYNWMSYTQDRFEYYSNPKLIKEFKTLLPEQKKNVNKLKFNDYNNYNFPAVENYLKPYVAENPQTKFYFFFAPHHQYYYYGISTDEFKRQFYLRRKVVEEISEFKNAEIYAFDDHTKITHNMAWYKDQTHFHEDVNKLILEEIAAGRGQLTKNNIEQYERTFLKNMKKLQIYSSKQDLSLLK